MSRMLVLNIPVKILDNDNQVAFVQVSLDQKIYFLVCERII